MTDRVDRIPPIKSSTVVDARFPPTVLLTEYRRYSTQLGKEERIEKKSDTTVCFRFLEFREIATYERKAGLLLMPGNLVQLEVA